MHYDICIIVDTPNMDPSDNYHTTYDNKTKIVVFYSLITKVAQVQASDKPQMSAYLHNKQRLLSELLKSYI